MKMRNLLMTAIVVAFSGQVMAIENFPNALIKPSNQSVVAEQAKTLDSASTQNQKVELPSLNSLPPLRGELDKEESLASIDTPDKRIARLYVAAVLGKTAILKSAPFIPGMATTSTTGGMSGASGMSTGAGSTSGAQQQHSPMTNMKTYTYRVTDGQEFEFFGDWVLQASVKNGEVTLKRKNNGKNKIVFFGTVDSADYKFAHKPTELETKNDNFVKSAQPEKPIQSGGSSSSSSNGQLGGGFR